MDNKEKSNVMLASNIMIRAKYDREPWAYVPADLLPPEYSDSRAIQFLSPGQKKQMEKKLFYADRIIDED